MFHQGSEKALLTFQDVVTRFSQEEWGLLHKWQNDLYTHLMEEIHQVFLSLGPVIASSIFSLRDNEKEGLRPVDDEDSDRRHNDDCSQSATISKLDVFTLRTEVVQSPKDPLKTDRMESPKPFRTEMWESPDPLGTDGRQGHDPLGIDRKESSFPLGTDRRQSHNPLGTDRKENPDPLGTDRRKSHDMLSTSLMNWCKEQEFTTTMVSDSIKEEEEAYPVAEQNPVEVKNKHSSAGDPVVSSGFSQRFTDQETTLFQQELVYEGINMVEQSKERSTSKKGPQASSEYKTVSTLKSTIALHQTMRPNKNFFNCNVYEQSFTEKDSLQIHVGVHTGAKLFPCIKCEKTFTLKSNLHRHLRVHTGLKPFPCTECEKSFSQHCDLQRHMRIHTGVKPFHCTECGKSFTQKTHLQGHLRIHTGVKLFP